LSYLHVYCGVAQKMNVAFLFATSAAVILALKARQKVTGVVITV
jgi:hypothetical protein